MTSRRHGRVALAAAVLASLAGCAAEPTANDTEPAKSPQASAEHARLQHFWETFRSATRARIAGRIDEAVELYGEALAIDPKHEDSLFYLGQCHRKRREYDAALARWQQLVEIQPQAKRGFSEIGLLLSSARDGAPFDLERAREAFETAFAMNPEESGSMLHLGELAVARGDREEAERMLEGVRRSNPRSVAAPYLLGYVAWSRGELDAARVLFDEAAARLQVEQGHSPSFEGKTKKGAAAMVDTSGEGGSLLEAFWLDWEKGRAAAEPSTEAELTEVYGRIDRFLVALRDSGPGTARALRPDG